MRLHLIAIAALPLLAACASKEYSTVPDPTGDWVALNPPGFQGPVAPPVRPVVVRRPVRVYPRRPVPVRTADGGPEAKP